MIKQYVKGNMLRMMHISQECGLTTTFGHGCNCFTRMYSGIAGQITQQYPEVAKADDLYHDKHLNNGLSNEDMLGTYDKVKLGSVTLLNLYTQYYPGPDVRYDAIRMAFRQIEHDKNISSLIIPRIGAGIAGGSWDKIEQIINEEAPTTHITVVDWDGSIFSPEDDSNE